MPHIPESALQDQSHPFWAKFWAKVDVGITVDQIRHLIASNPEHCPFLLWQGATTRNGYGRVISGVGGEMLSQRVAWSFQHLDPVPAGCDVDHRDECFGGKLCMFPGCLVLRPAAGRSKDSQIEKIVRAYNTGW